MQDPPSDHQGRIRTAIDAPYAVQNTGLKYPEARLTSNELNLGTGQNTISKSKRSFFVDHIKLFAGELPLPSTSIPQRVLCLPVLEQRSF